ncbi:MAG: BCD family MFS transporter [Gemmatimonadota bacterium]|nr:BCD family MFS transporter [Gemmatimonadota bacterium]
MTTRFFLRLGALGTRWLPFADAASPELPLSRLLRLGLLQGTVGMSLALLAGTLNRVMIVELAVAAVLVAVLLALPMLLAPLRALIGHRSDQHRSAFGWRRVPYLWFGTLAQFGGFAILPFGLLLLSEAVTPAVRVTATVGAALGFLMVGLGAHTVQTTGLALATDLAAPAQRPRVVALLYLLFLAGMLASAFAFSLLLRDYTPVRLIQVVQGAALVTVFLNVCALWKQEPRDLERAKGGAEALPFREAWKALTEARASGRLFAAVGLGALGFGMQDVLLEPYGGEILRLGVGTTSGLTALAAFGALGALALSARALERGFDPYRLAALGALGGAFALAAVILAAPLRAPWLLQTGSAVIGFGGGLFTVGTLTAAMGLDDGERHGLVMGAWGAVYTTSAGLAVAAGGLLRDAVLHASGSTGAFAGYSIVYHLEILALFLAMVAIGPLTRPVGHRPARPDTGVFGLAEFPS